MGKETKKQHTDPFFQHRENKQCIAGLVLQDHVTLRNEGRGGCSDTPIPLGVTSQFQGTTVHALHGSLVPIHIRSAVQSLATWSSYWIRARSCSHSQHASWTSNHATGANQAALHFHRVFASPFSTLHQLCPWNLLLHCYIQALIWACKNGEKAFIRTTPALQRLLLLLVS